MIHVRQWYDRGSMIDKGSIEVLGYLIENDKI